MVDRRAFRTSHPRHARTRLAAVLLCAGLGVTSAPHAMAAPNDDPNSVASLANDLTQAQKKLTELQNEQGGIHQEANKTVYELDEATSDANDAQEKVVQARARLDKSQKDVEEAQDKLNSLSRSQYTQGQDSNAVTMAAGEDAVANTLDRASYLRTEAAKQRKVVSQLDKVRTQAANEESSLRKLLADASAKRKDAKESKDKALEAIQTASRKAADLQKSIQEAEARKNEIQSRLDEVKGDKAGSSSNSTAAPAQNNASDTSAVGLPPPLRQRRTPNRLRILHHQLITPLTTRTTRRTALRLMTNRAQTLRRQRSNWLTTRLMTVMRGRASPRRNPPSHRRIQLSSRLQMIQLRLRQRILPRISRILRRMTRQTAPVVQIMGTTRALKLTRALTTLLRTRPKRAVRSCHRREAES